MGEKQRWKWEKIVLASRNKHKIKELSTLFEREFALPVSGIDGYDFPDVVEDGETFEANAIKKAKAVAKTVKLPVVADDSGLVVEALDGAPGVHSARYAGEHGNDAANNQKLLEQLRGVPEENRGAAFICVLAMVVPGKDPIVVRGECQGQIVFHPRGTNGFGYDPLFALKNNTVTMAELSPEEKDKVSHRGRALQALIRHLKRHFRFQGRVGHAGVNRQ